MKELNNGLQFIDQTDEIDRIEEILYYDCLTPTTRNLRIGDAIIEIDQRYFRPTEVDDLIGDAGKAKRKLGWEPKVKFKELVRIMVDADLKLFTQ